ncbi:protein O-mannosyl-transferase TMTC1-like [Diabrotica virgifera virgifera]|uniref:dolichyl-phosphate-mannose--protein mannosyltransferase n=1 Tax=Diabrotica virgifera virgifera TaxID=50390 RepID=A0ABM5KAA1_DIAVI|nr:protein O-mannosyl-transferase TMTC1-like [Diabrotica virgifera virgifera]XP_050507115.1 protein O-mannosyl-transferase TMTC1-like [Diabrotica virgifera virgifera]XP_050507116.1 protein O-mannosyl-transferase TMTC1-like [Diabrotica virgifera virgifera]XP_050507117.1 protein O-mannosyl-transferase TMTC1-like [Diabrotica virgifera virgifera]
MPRKVHNPTITINLQPSTLPLYSLVATVAIACYVNGLNGNFVHDDIPALTVNKDVLAINKLRNIFLNDFWGTPMADANSHKSYRPLTTLSFRWNYQLFGLKPLCFHLTNVLLHALASVLFTKLCICVASLRPPFSAIAGLIFAVHPIHTEAVTGIVGRADVLACVFFLISILLYHSDSERCYLKTSIFLAGFSMLAKETGVTVFLLNLALDFYFSWSHLKRSSGYLRWNGETFRFVNRIAKVLASFGVLLSLRLAMLQGSFPKFSQQDNPAAFHPSMCVRFLTYSYLVAFNFWLLLCPCTLSHDWQMGSIPLITSVNDSRNILTVFIFGMLLLFILKVVTNVEGQTHTPIVLGLLLLTVPFLPATNLLVTVGFVVAERVLYIPSLGFILLVVYGLQIIWTKYSRQRQTISVLLLLFLVTQSLRTIMRNRDWRSREWLLRSGLKTLPHNAKMHYNYANFLRDSSQQELAKTHYYKAIELWPTYASAHNNLGTLLNNKSEAEEHFLSAINYSSDHINAHYNLGQLYRKLSRLEDSEEMLKKCISLEPAFTPAYVEMSKLLGSDHDDLYKLLKSAVELSPNDPFYGTQLGHLLTRKGNYQQAIYYYWKALRVSPSHYDAIIGTANVLRKFGQKSRLFQLLTRWQLIRKGKALLKVHVYLQEWQLRTELNIRAKEYDSSIIYKQKNTISNSSRLDDKTDRWYNNSHKTALTSSHLMLDHLLDTS